MDKAKVLLYNDNAKISKRKEIMKMSYLYEMHAHTVEVSTCARATAKEMIEYYEGKGYTGIVSTNHMNSSTFSRVGLTDAPWNEKVDHFMKGYNLLKEAAGNKYHVLLGVEICFHNDPNDYLVYGVTEDFLRSHGDLMSMDMESFSKLAKENGLIFLQAHPFRRGLEVADWEYLDGYEVFNGNPRHNSCNDIAEIWAKKHGKSIVVSGSDFHQKGDEGIGGIYFEKEIKTNDELIEELRKGNYTLKKGV